VQGLRAFAVVGNVANRHDLPSSGAYDFVGREPLQAAGESRDRAVGVGLRCVDELDGAEVERVGYGCVARM
jgi:hypothetical protein